MTLRIKGGRVIDPMNDVDAVRDVWVADGRVIAAPADPDARPDRTIDASGYVVMPGGVDMHCHIAGSKVNAARATRPEDKTGHIPRTASTRRAPPAAPHPPDPARRAASHRRSPPDISTRGSATPRPSTPRSPRWARDT